MPNDTAYWVGDTWDIYPRHIRHANAGFYDSHIATVNVSKELIPYEPGNMCIYDNE
jgi:hypothetical protein